MSTGSDERGDGSSSVDPRLVDPRTVVLSEYDPAWAASFEELRARLQDALGDLARSIEHVGSTSVPGLLAKPILDVDVVIKRQGVLAQVIPKLEALGYTHEGDKGIPGREAFRHHEPDPMEHHLYVCAPDCTALLEHLLFRDRLRADEALRAAYVRLKRNVARRFAHDRPGYTDAKTAFILAVLSGAQSCGHGDGN